MDIDDTNTSSKRKVSREIVEKSIKKEIYDEYESSDSDIPLRTLINFEIIDKNSKAMVALDQISKCSNLLMRGTVLEPLPQKWRDCMVSLLTTTPAETRLSVQEYANVITLCNAPLLDWDSLREGDIVDGYCPQTFRWYEAKIVKVGENNDKVKIHFKGWNSKYDEWVERNSARLTPPGVSQQLINYVDHNAARSIPWYIADDSNLLAKASEILNEPIPIRQQQRVIIDGLEDMCVDYTFPNPSLWVCVSSGVWYRLAGALCPSGVMGSPTDSYRPYFLPAWEMFVTAGHVAMAAFDSVNPAELTTSPTLQQIIEEVSLRSANLINEVIILQHSGFLVEQLEEVQLHNSQHVEDETERTIGESLFFQQLKKEGASFIQGGGRDALVRGDYKGPAAKRRLAIAQGDATVRPRPPPGTTEMVVNIDEGGGEGGEGDEDGDGRRKKRRKSGMIEYPVEDLELFGAPHYAPEAPLPEPQGPEIFPSLHESCRGAAQERLVYMYTSLTLFPADCSDSILVKSGIPNIETLSHWIESPEQYHAELRKLFCPLVAQVLFDRLHWQPAASETSETLGGAFHRALLLTSAPLLQLLGRTATLSDLLCALLVGNAWEVIVGELYASSSVHERLAQCNTDQALIYAREVFERLCATVDCSPFLQLSDELTEHYLDGYTPIALSVVQERLLSGWYLPVEEMDLIAEVDDDSNGCKSLSSVDMEDVVACVAPLHPPTRLLCPSYCGGTFQLGEVVHAYSLVLRKWLEAVVVDLYRCDSQFIYRIRYVGWGMNGEEEVRADEGRLLPECSKAVLERTKRIPPDEFVDRTPNLLALCPQLIEVNNTDEDDHSASEDDGENSDEDRAAISAQQALSAEGTGIVGFLRDLAAVFHGTTSSHPYHNTAEAALAFLSTDPVVETMLTHHTASSSSRSSTCAPLDEKLRHLGPGRHFSSPDLLRGWLLASSESSAEADMSDLTAVLTGGVEEVLAKRSTMLSALWAGAHSLAGLPLAWRVYALHLLVVDYLDSPTVTTRFEAMITTTGDDRESLGGALVGNGAAAAPRRRRRGGNDDDDVVRPRGQLVEPLGCDRYGARYFLCASPSLTGQSLERSLLCERIPSQSPVGIGYGWWHYHNAEDVRSLIEWLDMRGNREMALLHSLCRVAGLLDSADQRGSTEETSAALDTSTANAAMEDDAGRGNVARRKARKQPKDLYKELRALFDETMGGIGDALARALLRCSAPSPLSLEQPTAAQAPVIPSSIHSSLSPWGSSSANSTIDCLRAGKYILLRMQLKRDEPLGVGVQSGGPAEGCPGVAHLFVTSFRSPTCLAALGGLRLGDRLIHAHGVAISNAGHLKTALAKAAAEMKSTLPFYHFDLLICRLGEEEGGAEANASFAHLLRRDATAAGVYRSASSNGTSSRDKESQGEVLNAMICLQTTAGAMGEVVAAITRLVDTCAHAFAVCPDSVAAIHRRFNVLLNSFTLLYSQQSAMAAAVDDFHRPLLRHAVAIAGQLEHALRMHHTVLHVNWPLGGRVPWVADCKQLLTSSCGLLTTASVSHLLARLYCGIDWDAVRRYSTAVIILSDDLSSSPASVVPPPAAATFSSTAATTSLNRRTRSPSPTPSAATTPPPTSSAASIQLTPRQWLERLASSLGFGSHLLRPGGRVLYFNDGHAHALAHHHRSHLSLVTSSGVLPAFIDNHILPRTYSTLHSTYTPSRLPDDPANSGDQMLSQRCGVLWGDTLRPSSQGAVWLCTVQTIRYFPRAPIPFAQVSMNDYIHYFTV